MSMRQLTSQIFSREVEHDMPSLKVQAIPRALMKMISRVKSQKERQVPLLPDDSLLEYEAKGRRA